MELLCKRSHLVPIRSLKGIKIKVYFAQLAIPFETMLSCVVVVFLGRQVYCNEFGPILESLCHNELTHRGLVAPYDIIDPGHYCLG